MIKRSTANTTGTFVAGTAVQADSADATATATVGHYTANPGGLGTTVGNVSIVRVASPVAVPGSFAGVAVTAEVDMLSFSQNVQFDKSVVLNGTAQGLCLNFAGAALVAGQTHYYRIVWIEE